MDYPLRDLVLHTNYTATVRGLRGPNFTSPASITFTTGAARGMWMGKERCKGAERASSPSSLPFFPSQG